MERFYIQSMHHILILFIMVMTGVQLQSEYWNSKYWVPDSEVVSPQPLFFPHYRISQRDYDYFTKPTSPHHAGVNSDNKETGVSRDSGNIGSWVKNLGKEMQNDGGLIDGRHHEQNEKSENNEYDTTTNVFNNITWGTEYGKDRVKNHKSDFGLNISGYQLNDKNREAIPSNIGNKKVDNYRSGYDLDMMGNHKNDPNTSVMKTSLVKHKGHTGEQNQNYSDIRSVERQYSESSPTITRQEIGPAREGHRRLGQQKSGSAANNPSEHSDHNINTGTQKINEEKLDGSLQRINSFEGNRFSDFDTNREKRGFEDKIIRDRYNLGSNRFRAKTWQSDLDTEGNRDNKMQSGFDSKRSLHSIIAWNGDSGRIKEQKEGTQGKRDSGRNNFSKWRSHSGSNSEVEVSNYQKVFDSRFNPDRWYSDTGTGDESLRILGENHGDSNVQHSYYSTRNSFGDVWVGDTDAVTEGEHTSRGKEATVRNIFDSEGHRFDEVNWQNNYRTPTAEYEPGQEEFNFQVHRLGDVTWGSGYSSGSEYHVPDFNQEHEFDSSRNRFSGTSWQSDYSFGGERQHMPVYTEADGELIKNQYTGANVPFLHGGHPLRAWTRVATGPPTAVTSYILPNGTRVVKLRRIVLYRKLQTSPDEDSPRTFADIAKGILQKKVAKFLSLFTIVEFPNEPCQTAGGVNGTCYHHLECKSLGGVASGSCAQGYGVCCYFEKSCGEVTRQNCSYFVNPGYPSPITNMLACILIIEKAHPDVSQIRLDFFMFELLGPTNGTCIDDQFIVTGQNTNSITPIICGINTGQHIYMDVDTVTGPLRLNMLTMRNNLPRSFKIKVTQIKKGSPLEAPRNCFQYYRGVQGSIESFNYQTMKGSNLPIIPGYMNNLNYAICIHKEPGYCSVTYTNTAPDGTAYPFQLTNVDQDGHPLIPPGQAGAEIFNCPDDYIVINGIRLCGERLNDASVKLDYTRNYPVTDTSNGPFMIPVRTNANTNGKGFRIDYLQNSCAT